MVFVTYDTELAKIVSRSFGDLVIPERCGGWAESFDVRCCHVEPILIKLPYHLIPFEEECFISEIGYSFRNQLHVLTHDEFFQPVPQRPDTPVRHSSAHEPPGANGASPPQTTLTGRRLATLMLCASRARFEHWFCAPSESSTQYRNGFAFTSRRQTTTATSTGVSICI